MKKLTDNEIIKALRCCSIKRGGCKECPLWHRDGSCTTDLAGQAFNLASRQQAEIEALKMDNEQLQNDIVNANGNYEEIKEDCELLKTALAQKIVPEIKSKAIKEFAETFLEIVQKNHYLLVSQNNSKDYGMFTTGIEQAVNEAIKEMVGGENDG